MFYDDKDKDGKEQTGRIKKKRGVVLAGLKNHRAETGRYLSALPGISTRFYRCPFTTFGFLSVLKCFSYPAFLRGFAFALPSVQNDFFLDFPTFNSFSFFGS